MNKEEYISTLRSVKEMNVDQLPLQFCLDIIVDALIFLLNDKSESEGELKHDKCRTSLFSINK